MVEYLPDRDVDACLDEALRALFSVCFTKAQDAVFQRRRYFVDPYPHRWVIRGQSGRLVAHAGVHAKCVVAGDVVYRAGGVCEVCVHPDDRGRGYVKAMLARIRDFLITEQFDFGLLFGDPEVYRSSGYRTITNLSIASDPESDPAARMMVTGMILELGRRPWPDTAVYLPGGKF